MSLIFRMCAIYRTLSCILKSLSESKSETIYLPCFFSMLIKSPMSVPSSSQILPITVSDTASPLTIFDILVGDTPV